MSTVSYIELLSACFSGATQASRIICQTLEEGRNQSVLNKSDDQYDPQTIADIGAQHIIQSGLLQLFPKLPILAEEPEDSMKHYLQTFQINPIGPKLDTTLFTQQLSSIQIPPQLAQLDLKHLLILIDPLDGTSEYTQGLKDHVTTLISITYHGYALGGVIYYPFSDKALYGGIGIGCYTYGSLSIIPQRVTQKDIIATHPFFKTFCAGWLETVNIPAIELTTEIMNAYTKPIKVVTTRSHFSPDVLNYFTKIGIDPNTQVIRHGGAGNKGVMVFTGEATAYIYPKNGTSRWDIGCLDGLFYAYGGKLTDINNNLYKYDDGEIKNVMGCVCSLFNHDQYCLPIDTTTNSSPQTQ